MGQILRFAVLSLALLALGGCVYEPAPPPPYGGYAYGPPAYYYGPPVEVGVGFGGGCCWHHWR